MKLRAYSKKPREIIIMAFLRKISKIPLRGYQFLSYDALQHAHAIPTLSNDPKLRKRLRKREKESETILC